MATLTEQQRREQQQLAFGLLLGAAVLALPALILSFLLRFWANRNHRRWRWPLLGLVALVGVGALYLLRDGALTAARAPYEAIQDRRWEALWPAFQGLWLWSLPIAPLLALMFNSVLPVSAEEQERRKVVEAAHQEQRRSDQAAKKSGSAPDEIDGGAVLGAVANGDLHDWTHKGWLIYPADMLQRHLVVVGGSGSGKTETLLRLAYLAARVYGWQVVYLDAKGDRDTARRFRATMVAAGQQQVVLFPTFPYDAWRGDGQQLLNRLLAVEDFQEPYYKNVAKLLLGLAVNAPGGPPRDSRELLKRLDLVTLADLYRGQPQMRDVERVTRHEANGVYLRYSAFFGALQDTLDGAWAYEDAGAAYVLLEGLALKEEAQSAGRLLLEDWAQYVARRKEPNRRTLLIVDEWSALATGGADAANLFERVRSFGASVVASSQSYAGLGRDADRILDAAAGLLIHACADPDRLSERAGTRRRMQRSIHIADQGPTGRGTLRPEDAPRVEADQVRQLQQGECMVVVGGRAARVRVAQAPLVEAALSDTYPRWVPPSVATRRETRPTAPASTAPSTPPAVEPSAPQAPPPHAAPTTSAPVAPQTPATRVRVMQPPRPPASTPAPPPSIGASGGQTDNHTPIESDF